MTRNNSVECGLLGMLVYNQTVPCCLLWGDNGNRDRAENSVARENTRLTLKRRSHEFIKGQQLPCCARAPGKASFQLQNWNFTSPVHPFFFVSQGNITISGVLCTSGEVNQTKLSNVNSTLEISGSSSQLKEGKGMHFNASSHYTEISACFFNKSVKLIKWVKD